jgi:hypothetical protein
MGLHRVRGSARIGGRNLLAIGGAAARTRAVRERAAR